MNPNISLSMSFTSKVQSYITIGYNTVFGTALVIIDTSNSQKARHISTMYLQSIRWAWGSYCGRFGENRPFN